MSQITDILKSLGLSATESAIYLAGLGQPAIGVNELVKYTRIKRTTVYHALETLMEKGLAAKKGTARRLVYVMTRPEHLQKLLDERIKEIEAQKQGLTKIIPLLAQRTAALPTAVQVSHFEGIEGIKLVVEEALYAKSRRWDILAPSKNFFSEFDKAYSDYFMTTRRARGIVTRSLWEHDPNRRILTAQEISERQPRFLSKAMRGKFNSVMILFDDKVALISSLRELNAVLIQSQEFHATMEAMFEGLWLQAEPYEQIIKK
ncbi:MAG: helix-turn-helix domain-containing protein [bacterium]|nr:helix-turn-helix domain-containing protein [bacterium]